MQNVETIQKYTSSPKSTLKSSRGSRQKADRATILAIFGAMLIILPLLVISGTIIFFQIRQMNLPGVMICHQEVGMITRDDTAALIDAYWNQNRQIELTSSQNPGDSYLLIPGELGYWVDSRATADAAYQFGRAADPFSDVISAASGNAQVVMPILYFNEHTARQTLTTIAEELSIPAEEAKIVYQDDAWVALPGKAGQAVDVEAALDTLYNQAFNILLAQSVTLEVTRVEPEISDLTPVLEDIETLITQDLSFQAYDPITDEDFIWSVPLKYKQTWVEVDSNTSEIGLSPGEEAVQNLLDQWEDDLGAGRSWDDQPEPEIVIENWIAGRTLTAIIKHDPTAYHVGAGESLWSISLKLGMPMWRIMDINEGLTINTLEAGMTLTIPSKNDLLPLPVVLNKRIVIDISEQRMTVYENGEVRSTHLVSTGMADSPTMAGIFQIQTHELNAYASNWDLYMPHFMGIYEAWHGFMNGIHGLPLLSNGQRLWANALGSPASYGCIILDLTAAENLYYWAEPGVIVEIIY